MSNESKKSSQVIDTDAALTDKDPAALTLNPNPSFAKPDPTMGEDEGWNSDATGETLGGDQPTNSSAERHRAAVENTRPSWQSENRKGWQTGESMRDQSQTGNQQNR